MVDEGHRIKNLNCKLIRSGTSLQTLFLVVLTKKLMYMYMYIVLGQFSMLGPGVLVLGMHSIILSGDL